MGDDRRRAGALGADAEAAPAARPARAGPRRGRLAARGGQAATAEPTCPEAADGGTLIVKPVANAMRILRHLSENGKPAGATELARRLNINTSTCFNILRTLVSEGVMEFDPASKTYRPGVGLLKLVDSTLSEGHRLEMAKPVLHELAERRAVTATLWRRIGDQRIVLAAVEHNLRDMRIHMSTGQRLPLLLGATGRLLAGELGLTQAQARSMFAGLRWARPLAFEQYWDEVELARARGWAVDDGYFAPGILAVATAVRDGGGRLAFALSSVMFRGQYDEAAIEALGVEMQALSDKLGKILF